MKKVMLLTIMALSLTIIALADIPKTIHYQGRLTDTVGTPIGDGTYSIVFRLWDAETNGTELWNGTYDVATKNGYYNAELGSGLYPLTSLAFDQAYFMDMKVGGDPDYMSPRIKLNSSAYALVADRATTIADNSITTANIQDNAVTTGKIAADAITSEKILTGAVKGSDITTTLGERLTVNNIEPWTLHGSNISNVPGTRITNQNLEDNTINNRTLADGAVDSQAKAPWAPIVAANGGGQLSNPKILFGSITSNASGDFTIDITGYSFIGAPKVYITISGAAGHFAKVLTVNTTQIIGKTLATNGSSIINVSATLDYLIIGN